MAKIGQEVLFGLDNFQKPKLLSLKDTVAQQLINLLLMRPGNIPSLPHIGINVEQYLYKLQGDVDEEEIKQKIYNQCSELMSYISLGEVQIFTTIYKNKDLLILVIPIVGFGQEENLILALSQSQNEVNVAYQFEEINSTVNN